MSALPDPHRKGDHERPHIVTAPKQPDDLGFDLPPPAKVSKVRVLTVAAVVLAVLLVAFLVAWLPKRNAQRELATNTLASGSAVPRVQVVAPKPKSSDHAVTLPGSVQALEETVVYARANGYVRKWIVDIGDKVKEGDVLVEIDTPELDQQLYQARAQLVQAEAGLGQAVADRGFSRTNLARYKDLAPKGVASQQELEQHQAQATVDEAKVKVAEAAIQAQQANVRRLNELKSFSHVTAPFAGTVNTRMFDVGALVSGTTALYKISAVDPVRVFVQVPQDIAPGIRADVPAGVTVREYGGRVFQGKVSRSAGALDPASRTMNTEVRVPNPKGELIVGMYAQVSLTLPSPHRVLEIPATALMNDAKGLRVATVGADDKIHIVKVTVERDTGSAIEIADGLDESDRVVTLAGAELVDGKSVEVIH